MPHRSAESGKYVTKSFADKNPKTTVKETDKPSKPSNKGGGKGKKGK